MDHDVLPKFAVSLAANLICNRHLAPENQTGYEWQSECPKPSAATAKNDSLTPCSAESKRWVMGASFARKDTSSRIGSAEVMSVSGFRQRRLPDNLLTTTRHVSRYFYRTAAARHCVTDHLGLLLASKCKRMLLCRGALAGMLPQQGLPWAGFPQTPWIASSLQFRRSGVHQKCSEPRISAAE